MTVFHTLRDLHAETRERAFMKWRSSGYRDAEAWAQFVEAYLKANAMQQRINAFSR
jgi:hypothetical protein